MTHPRQSLREAVKGALADLPLDVYTNRTSAFGPRELKRRPAAVIVTDTERSQRLQKSGGLLRTISLVIVVTLLWEEQSIDDVLDDWAEKIEARIPASLAPADVMQLVGTSIEFSADEEGAHWFAYLALEYEGTVIG